MVKCPKCGHECMVNEVAVICPNCDYLSMKKMDWRGEHISCPKCSTKARVYKHSKGGKSFICDNCRTVGRYLDENKLHTKIVKKDSTLGKRLSWLFEVPCKYWFKKESVEDTICKKCEMRDVCKAHSEEIDRFTKKKGVEVYMHKDFIEIVHG